MHDHDITTVNYASPTATTTESPTPAARMLIACEHTIKLDTEGAYSQAFTAIQQALRFALRADIVHDYDVKYGVMQIWSSARNAHITTTSTAVAADFLITLVARGAR